MFKMPKFLVLLFFTEMWERFSYYGMRALLVLFLTKMLGFKDERAYAIYSLFAALGYAGPVVGGIIADKFLGFRKMVTLGGIVIALGHFLMVLIPLDDRLIYLGLALIAVGTGMFKGNITNLLGACYEKNDPERDRGFTLFYVGVNVGSVLASLACAVIADLYGWHYGFGMAGIGMLLGLATFISFQSILGDKGLPPKSATKTTGAELICGMTPFNFVLIASILTGMFVSVMLYYSENFGAVLAVVGVLVYLYLFSVVKGLKYEEKKNIGILMALTFFSMMFYALEMQLGSLFNLFTDRNVTREVFGYTVPTAVCQAINPFSIIILGPIVSQVFMKLGQEWSMKRFALGLLAMIACFAILYYGCLMASPEGDVAYGYLFVAICFMGFGELCIAPVIQSLYTILSPFHIRGFLMGVYMLSMSFSNLSGNLIGRFMSVDAPSNVENFDKLSSLAIYQEGFLKIMLFNAALFVLFGIMYRLLQRNVQQGYLQEAYV